MEANEIRGENGENHMYPFAIIKLGDFLSINLYDILFLLGLVAALIVFDRLCIKKKVPNSVNKFYYILSIVSIGLGVVSAMLFQSVYNWIEKGFQDFELKGMTFMGGLIGGVIVFLIGYKLFAKERDKRYFWRIVEFAPACVAIAHCLGRLGCLMAGCCYGKLTDLPFPLGADMYIYVANQGYEWQHRLPTQLFEAVFLLILFVVLMYLILKDRKWSVIVYTMSYSVFRFLIEFLRDDPRGKLLGFMTPSQTQVLLLFLVGVFFLILRLLKRYRPALMQGKFKALDGYLDPDYVYELPEEAPAAAAADSASEEEHQSGGEG